MRLLLFFFLMLAGSLVASEPTTAYPLWDGRAAGQGDGGAGGDGAGEEAKGELRPTMDSQEES
jgi:hypothetical protein